MLGCRAATASAGDELADDSIQAFTSDQQYAQHERVNILAAVGNLLGHLNIGLKYLQLDPAINLHFSEEVTSSR